MAAAGAPAPSADERVGAVVLTYNRAVEVVTGKVLVGGSGRVAPACLDMAASPLGRTPDLTGAALLGFHAGASVVRRSAFLDAGGFEPRLLIGAEETQLALDLTSAGWS